MKTPITLLNSSEDDFGVFARGTIIDSHTARFLLFDPGQYQGPVALGARWPESVDEF
jgi:hypothetical protein